MKCCPLAAIVCGGAFALMAATACPADEVCGPSEAGSPLTLMQWGYGDGDDPRDVYPGAIETDRPYFTKSASVVGLTNWQLETGATYGRDGRRLEIISFPEALLRVGMLAEWFEFRFGWNWVDNIGRHTGSDVSDPSVGMKFALTPQEDMLPQTAVVIDADLPSSEFNSTLSFSKLQPGLNFIYRWDLSDGYSMGGATEFRRIVDRHDHFVLFAQSWLVQKSFTDLLTGYAEWYLLAPDTGRGTPTQDYLDAGLLYLLTENLQLDTSAGCGLTSAALDYYIGGGVSVRW